MSNGPNYCLGCGTILLEAYDADLSGESNCVCARCRAEEEHDFDFEPDVEFSRSGTRVEDSAR